MNWFSALKGEKIPEQFADYAQSVADRSLLKKPLAEARFVVLDTETTGLDPKKDRILSIGAVAVSGYSASVADSFEAHLKQDFDKNETIAVHEITPGSSAQAELPKAVLADFIHYLKGDIIIGHYVDFDFKILSESCKRNLGFGLKNKRYDTMQLLKRTDTHFRFENLNKPEDWGLDKICERFQIPISDRHTAMGDAIATALLFARQLKKLEKRGVKTVGELLKR